MHLTRADIQAEERIKRLNIINSISGIKPANLVGTIDGKGQTNLAIFSSAFHLGSNPALVGMILRPDHEVRRHTWENIKETGYYTLNHVHESFIQQAHYTSAKFEKEESEFAGVGLTEQYVEGFVAPLVAESKVKMGLKFEQSVPIEMNGTIMIIGSVEHLLIPDDAVDERGHLDLSQLGGVGISGLNSYYKLEKMAKFPYARKSELPDFS